METSVVTENSDNLRKLRNNLMAIGGGKCTSLNVNVDACIFRVASSAAKRMPRLSGVLRLRPDFTQKGNNFQPPNKLNFH